MLVRRALIVVACSASAAHAGVVSRVSAAVVPGSPPVLVADATVPTSSGYDGGPIAGASIQGMTSRPSESTIRRDAGVRGEAIGVRQIWFGWRRRWLTAAVTLGDPVGDVRYASDAALAPPTDARVYGLELRARGVGASGAGIAGHIGWRAHRASYVWEWGNCRIADCSEWLPKSDTRTGEARGVGWVMGVSLFLPPMSRSRSTIAHGFSGAGFETLPRVAERTYDPIDCNSAGQCSKGDTPTPPEVTQEMSLGCWAGLKLDIRRHLHVFALGFVHLALEEDKGRYGVSTGAELAW